MSFKEGSSASGDLADGWSRHDDGPSAAPPRRQRRHTQAHAYSKQSTLALAPS